MHHHPFTCTHVLTLFWDDVQRHSEPSVFDEFHDICMRHADDGLSVHCQNPVSYLQLPTAVCRAALDYTSYLMGHSWNGQ